MMGSLLFAGAVIFVVVIAVNRSNRNARYKNYGNRTRSHSGDHYFITGTGADAGSYNENSPHKTHPGTDGHSGASHNHGHHHNHGGSHWDSGNHHGSHGGWDSGGHGSHGGGDFGGGGDSGGGDSGGGGGGD